MKTQFLLLGITGFLIMDTYYDGIYTEKIMSGKKYFKMATFGFIGLSLLTFMKKHPSESRQLFKNANDIIKYLPIDHNAGDLLGPIFNFTQKRRDLYSENFSNNGLGSIPPQTSQMKRMLNSGGHSTKRSVSESKKKYVAANQQWKCKHCNSQLDASYEVDHKVELQHGGSNHVSNLEALCRNCHGKKTMKSHIF